MQRYISLATLAALLGLTVGQNNTFLSNSTKEVELKSAKTACKIYKSLTYWDLSTMMHTDENGKPLDSIIPMVENIGYGPNAKLHYNLCAYTNSPCGDDKENVFAYISRTS